MQNLEFVGAFSTTLRHGLRLGELVKHLLNLNHREPAIMCRLALKTPAVAAHLWPALMILETIFRSLHTLYYQLKVFSNLKFISVEHYNDCV